MANFTYSEEGCCSILRIFSIILLAQTFYLTDDLKFNTMYYICMQGMVKKE